MRDVGLLSLSAHSTIAISRAALRLSATAKAGSIKAILLGHQGSRMSETPLQIWVLLITIAANALLGASGIVGLSIKTSVRLFAKETAVLHGGDPNVPLGETLEKAVDREVANLMERDPIGSILGVIERNIYLYALISQTTSFIGAVLLFKAFFGLQIHSGGRSVPTAPSASPWSESEKTVIGGPSLLSLTTSPIFTAGMIPSPGQRGPDCATPISSGGPVAVEYQTRCPAPRPIRA